MVSTVRPAASWTRVVQALTGRPSISTVQVPHTWTSHERLAPVEPQLVAEDVEQQLAGVGSQGHGRAVDRWLIVTGSRSRRPPVAARPPSTRCTNPSRYFSGARRPASSAAHGRERAAHRAGDGLDARGALERGRA